MGASLTGGGNGSGRRRTKRARRAPMAEINVTPFVDVMLVLLIIFMVTAPLLTVGVPNELPKTGAKQLAAGKEPLTITLDAKGDVFLQETKVAMQEIVPKLKAIAGEGYNEPIYVRGDRGIDYGAVMQVMARISSAGFKRVSLVTDVEGS